MLERTRYESLPTSNTLPTVLLVYFPFGQCGSSLSTGAALRARMILHSIHSTFHIPHSTLHTPHSTFHTPHADGALTAVLDVVCETTLAHCLDSNAEALNGTQVDHLPHADTHHVYAQVYMLPRPTSTMLRPWPCMTRSDTAARIVRVSARCTRHVSR